MNSNSGKSGAAKTKAPSTQAADKDVDGIRLNKSANAIEYHLVPSNKWATFDTANECEKPLAKYRKALCAKLNIQNFRGQPGDNFQLPCHQCRRRKPHFLICTKCHVSFCSKCLLNGEYEQEPGYISQDDYVCPVCRKICKCSRCQAKNSPVVSKMHTRSSDTKRVTRASQGTKEKVKQDDSEWYYDVDEIEEIKSDGENDESLNAEAINDNSADYTEGSESEDLDDEISDFSDGEEEEDDDLDDGGDASNGNNDNSGKNDLPMDEKRAGSTHKSVKGRQGSAGTKKTESRRNSRAQRQKDFSNDEVIISGIGVCVPKKVDVNIDVPPWEFVKEGENEGPEKQTNRSFDDSDEYYISIHNKMAKILEEEDKKLIEPLNKKRKTAQSQYQLASIDGGFDPAGAPSPQLDHSPVRDKKTQGVSIKSMSDDFIYEDETGILDNAGYGEEKLYKRKNTQQHQQKPKEEPSQKSSEKSLEAPVNPVKAQPVRRIKAPLIALPKSILNQKPAQQSHSVLFGKSVSDPAKMVKDERAVKLNTPETIIKKGDEHKEKDKKEEVINTQKENVFVVKKEVEEEKKGEEEMKKKESEPKREEIKKEENEVQHKRDENKIVERHSESFEKHRHHETKRPAVPSFLSMGTQSTSKNKSTTSTTAGAAGVSSTSTISPSTYQYTSIYANFYNKISTKINDAITSATGISSAQPSSTSSQLATASQATSTPSSASSSTIPTSTPQSYSQPRYQPSALPPSQKQQQNQQTPYYNKPPPPPSQRPSQYNQVNPNGIYNTSVASNYSVYNNNNNSRPYDNYSQPSYSQSSLHYDQPPTYQQQQQGMSSQYKSSWDYSRNTGSGPGYSGFRYSQDMCALCRVQQPTMMCPTCRAKLCSQECYTKHYNNEHYYKQYNRT